MGSIGPGNGPPSIRALLEAVRALDNVVIEGMVGFEGLPCAGKTFWAAATKAAVASGVPLVEHIHFDDDARRAAEAPWPTSGTSALKRQRLFLEVELKRQRVAECAVARGHTVVADRTILSPLVYFALRVWSNPRQTRSFLVYLDEVCTLARAGRLGLPECVVFLSVSRDISLRRARLARTRGDRRREPDMFLFDPKPFAKMRALYALALEELRRCRVIKVSQPGGLSLTSLNTVCRGSTADHTPGLRGS